MQELMLIALVALLVIGPERLPETLRTLGLWLGRLRRSFNSVKNEIEKEVGMDEIRRQLHNEAVMEEMKRIEREVNTSLDMNESNVIADSTPQDDATADDKAESESRTDTAPAEGEQVSAENSSEQSAEPVESAQPEETSEAPAPQPMPSGPLPRSEAELEAFHEVRKKQLAEREQAAKES